MNVLVRINLICLLVVTPGIVFIPRFSLLGFKHLICFLVVATPGIRHP